MKLLREIQAGKTYPVYLLHGEESYYTDRIAQFMEDTLLAAGERDFNCRTFYGKDAAFLDIIEACRQLPMFATLNLVFLKEAQTMKNRGNELDKLEIYAENPTPGTILVICYKEGKFDARKKLFKLIKEKGLVFESQGLKEPEIPGFIAGFLKRRNVQADAKAVDLLVEYLGTDLSKIANALEKLCINLGEDRRIRPADIQKNIGISKDYNVYELQSALLTKNFKKAFTVVKYINDNLRVNPFVLTIANVHAAFQKLYHYLLGGDVNDKDLYYVYQIHYTQAAAYKRARSLYSIMRVEEIFGMLLEYDLRSKGVHNADTTHQDLLSELVYKILN